MDANCFPLARRHATLWPMFVLALLLATPQSRAQNRQTPKADPLDLYAGMTHKTILHGYVPRLPDSLLPKMLTGTNEAIKALRDELFILGYNLVPAGEKFVQILPVSEGTNLHSAPLFHNSGATNDEKVANQTISLNIDLNTFLSVFTGVTRRTVLRPGTLPIVILSLKCTTPLTHEELNYAMGVVLSLSGFAVVEDGAKFAWVVPARSIAVVHANAPKPEPGAALIDPTNVPVVKPPSPMMAASRPPGASLPPTSAPATLDDLMTFYATQQGKTFQPSPQSANRSIIFEVRTPLTKAELLYAVETTMALNELVIAPVDDKTLRLLSVPQRHPPPKELVPH
jgi:hypothetical protein